MESLQQKRTLMRCCLKLTIKALKGNPPTKEFVGKYANGEDLNN
jgi:hypothetical protein